jgi:hypothetical protein
VYNDIRKLCAEQKKFSGKKMKSEPKLKPAGTKGKRRAYELPALYAKKHKMSKTTTNPHLVERPHTGMVAAIEKIEEHLYKGKVSVYKDTLEKIENVLKLGQSGYRGAGTHPGNRKISDSVQRLEQSSVFEKQKLNPDGKRTSQGPIRLSRIRIRAKLRFSEAKRRVDEYIEHLKRVTEDGKSFGLDEFVKYVLAEKVLMEIPFSYFEGGMPDHLKKEVRLLHDKLENIKEKQEQILTLTFGHSIDAVIERTKQIVEHADSFKQEVSDREKYSDLHQLRSTVRTSLGVTK